MKKELRSSDVKKIVCLGSPSDLKDHLDVIGKQTVYVLADKLMEASLSFRHPVIPMIINYGMPTNL